VEVRLTFPPRINARETQKKKKKNWAPTVVVEVEQGVMDSVVLGEAKSMKHLGSDMQTCRAKIVLSDTHGAFALPADDTRAKIIWVEDFSLQKAHKLLDELNFFPMGGISWGDGIDANNSLLRENAIEKAIAVTGTRAIRLK
jgi:hypothetical protein